MQKSFPSFILLPILWALGCQPEAVGVDVPNDTSAQNMMDLLPSPNYEVVMRVSVEVDAERMVTEARGDVLLQFRGVSGDFYTLVAGEVLSAISELHNKYLQADREGLLQPIVPGRDISIPIGEFMLRDLRAPKIFTVIVRNREPTSGVSAYQRLVIKFLPAM